MADNDKSIEQVSPWRSGDPIMAEDLNAILRAAGGRGVGRNGSLAGGGSIDASGVHGGRRPRPTVLVAATVTGLAGGGDPGHYEWTERYYDPAAGEWIVKPDGLTHERLGTAVDPAGVATAETGDTLVLWLSDDAAGDVRPVAVGGGGGGGDFFKVTVEMDGGASGAGDPDAGPPVAPSAATFTYTVTAMDGVTVLGEEVEVTKKRPVGKMEAAETGSLAVAYWEWDAGTEAWVVKLWDVQEVPAPSVCEPPEEPPP